MGRRGPKPNVLSRELILDRIEVDPVTGCWIWQLVPNVDGRAVVTIDRENWIAARAAWIAFNGPIPEGMCVCHRCDDPKCVRAVGVNGEPGCLFLASQHENLLDKTAKGRNGNCANRITEDDARAIIAARANGERCADVARRFGVSLVTVRMIFNGRTWRHLQSEKPRTEASHAA